MKPASKVAVVTTRHDPLDDRIYYKQAVSLAKRSSVMLIAPDGERATNWPAGLRFKPLQRRTGAVGRLSSIIDAACAVWREQPDFCHVHDLELALILPFVRLVTRSVLIYDSHEVFTKDDLLLNERISPLVRPVVARIVSLLERTLIRCSDHIITAVDQCDEDLGHGKIPVTAIFNYPPVQLFDVDPDRVATAKERYQGKVPIIYQGSVSASRGIFHMLDAICLIKEREPRILLRVIGLKDEDLRAEVCRLADGKGLHENVEVTGWVPHEEVLYAMMSSVVGLVPLARTPKYNRSVPIKLLEYMACGLPVVATDLPAMGRYVREAEAGLLYDPDRPEEMARCVIALIEDDETRKQMGENGRLAVLRRWNWTRMEELLFGVYESHGAEWNEAVT